jgi:hypothetical protein
MGIITRVRSVLWAEGPHYIGIYLGFVVFVIFFFFPWFRAGDGSILLVDHYVNFGNTWEWLNLLMGLGQFDVAIALVAALILFPFIFWWAFRNRPVITGLLCMVSGSLLTYVFKAMEFRGLLWELGYAWSALGKPYRIGLGAYGTIFTGGLLVFLYFFFNRSVPQEMHAGVLSRQKPIVQLLVRYLFLTGLLSGLTAGALYFFISNYAVYVSSTIGEGLHYEYLTFEVSYSWTLLIVGLGCVAVGVYAIPDREADETGSSRMLVTFTFPEWYRYSRRGSLGKFSTPFLLTGITLIGLAFYLFWLWSI